MVVGIFVPVPNYLFISVATGEVFLMLIILSFWPMAMSITFSASALELSVVSMALLFSISVLCGSRNTWLV